MVGFPLPLKNQSIAQSCVRITSYTNPVISVNSNRLHISQPFIESLLDRIEKLSIHTMKETQASIPYN